MKTNSKVSGYIIRSAAVAVLLLPALVTLSSAFNLPSRLSGLSWSSPLGRVAKPATKTRTLTFADRVAYQRAIEDVYWRHRIWPKENTNPKPPLDQVMSQAEVESKVVDYLRNSQLLEQYWQKPITPDQLQAEMDRMAQHTKQPEVLREIFAALGNDPLVIAECLARATLSQRLITDLYAHDERFHGELKRRAESDLATHGSVSEMKQGSATYSEIEWVKTNDVDPSTASRTSLARSGHIVGQAHRLPNEAAGGAPVLQQQDAPSAVRLNETEWNDRLQKLAQTLDASPERIPINKLSRLHETDSDYYSTAVITKEKNRLKLATISWQKQPFDSWRAKATRDANLTTTAAAVAANYTLPVIGAPDAASCADDTWNAISTTSAPDGREYHIAVWTGSEMLVWGGLNRFFDPLNTGARYNPSTDSWIAISNTNLLNPRYLHTAVWTGSEMIIWGGFTGSAPLNGGGRYNPFTDSWTATSATNAPTARFLHTAIWTGSEMIVWGGSGSLYFATGGRYNPTTDSWTATTTTNAPSARRGQTAVWTGTQMIVWGGFDGTNALNTGSKYSPASDSWTATTLTGTPSNRVNHTAVWTGNQMIVWGGSDNNGGFPNAGGRYNPSSDTWAPTTVTNAGDNGALFAVTVTNLAGSVTSNNATLTVR